MGPLNVGDPGKMPFLPRPKSGSNSVGFGCTCVLQYFYAISKTNQRVNKDIFVVADIDHIAGTTDISKLNTVCAQNSFRVVDVPQDGDCMFSALALQLNRESAIQMHSEMVDFLHCPPNLVSSTLADCSLQVCILLRCIA